jgi:hypothetical protein
MGAFGHAGISLGGVGSASTSYVWGGLNALGGYMRGPGTGTSDSIVARVSNGEFIVNATSTAMHRPLLEAINDNRSLPRYAAGGYVGPVPGSSFGGGAFSAPWVLQIVNESGNTVRDGGVSTKNGAPVQQLIIGAAADDVAGGGSLGRAIENTFGLKRVVR